MNKVQTLIIFAFSVVAILAGAEAMSAQTATQSIPKAAVTPTKPAVYYTVNYLRGGSTNEQYRTTITFEYDYPGFTEEQQKEIRAAVKKILRRRALSITTLMYGLVGGMQSMSIDNRIVVTGNIINYISISATFHESIAKAVGRIAFPDSEIKLRFIKDSSRVAMGIRTPRQVFTSPEPPRISLSTQSKYDGKVMVNVLRHTFDDEPQNSVTINFSRTFKNGGGHYRVISRGKSIIKGRSSLLRKLYFEPGLIASFVSVRSNSVQLIFGLRHPGNESQMSNILNRIITIVHDSEFPDVDMEIDGYNPLLGSTSPKPNFRVPPPFYER